MNILQAIADWRAVHGRTTEMLCINTLYDTHSSISVNLEMQVTSLFPSALGHNLHEYKDAIVYKLLPYGAGIFWIPYRDDSTTRQYRTIGAYCILHPVLLPIVKRDEFQEADDVISFASQIGECGTIEDEKRGIDGICQTLLSMIEETAGCPIESLITADLF